MVGLQCSNPLASGSATLTVFPQFECGTAIQGTWATAVDAGEFSCTYFANAATHATGDEYDIPGVSLQAGTYTISTRTTQNNDHGILKIYLDSDLVATFDLNGAPGANVLHQTTGVSIGTGLKTLKLVTNTSTSGDYFIGVTFINFTRTA